MKRLVLFAAAIVVLSTAHNASAQGFISPFVGTTLSSPSDTGSHTKPGYGFQFGSLGKVVGAETEFAYFPEVIDNTANGLAKSRVVTFGADTLIGPTIGNAKVYVAFGAGDLNLNVTGLTSVFVPNPTSISNNYFTFNVGGGAAGFFAKHLGVKGDLRYYKAFGFKIDDLANTGTLAFNKFDFWRGTIGLAVKF